MILASHPAIYNLAVGIFVLFGLFASLWLARELKETPSGTPDKAWDSQR